MTYRIPFPELEHGVKDVDALTLFGSRVEYPDDTPSVLCRTTCARVSFMSRCVSSRVPIESVLFV